MTLSECLAAYDAAICPDRDASPHSHRVLKGSARDAALLPLSCIQTLAFDNHGYSYPVFVGPGEFRDGAPVLTFVGSPSGWFVSDVLASYRAGRFPDGRIALDFGQGWFCINMDQVMEELIAKGVIA